MQFYCWCFLCLYSHALPARLQASGKQEPYLYDLSYFLQHLVQWLVLSKFLLKIYWFIVLCCLLCRTELTKSVVLPELIELSRDEGSSVRLAAFETLVNLLDIFDTGKSSCGHSFACESTVFPCFVSLSRVRVAAGWNFFCSFSWWMLGFPSLPVVVVFSLLVTSLLPLLPSWHLELLHIPYPSLARISI